MPDSPTIAYVAAAAIIAYFLGSLPTAYVAARVYGKDIFSIGSRQAGATNVWREVSRKAGVIVFLTDSSKGLTGMLIARLLGLDGIWLLLPASAIILGHWNSPLTRFRGGDGVSSLTGVVLGINPVTALIPYFVIGFITIRFNSRLEHPTLWGAVAGYLLYVGMGLTLDGIFYIEPLVVLGITGLGIAILLHSMTYHRRRIDTEETVAAVVEERRVDNRRT
jgi:glycerol-3-phosphate acyltransferase PlsY